MSEAEDLQRRVDEFSDRSLRFIQGLPHTQIAQRMAAQFQDASGSVASNYRAARRGRSYREFTAKIFAATYRTARRRRGRRDNEGAQMIKSPHG